MTVVKGLRMPEETLADRIAREITERKAELEPYVEEYRRLLAAEQAIVGTDKQ